MKQIIKYPLYVLLLLLASACVHDLTPGEIEQLEQDELYVTFTMHVPGQQAPRDTRAMDILAENAITRVDLLAFKVTDGGRTEVFDYHSVATGISDDRGDGSAKKFIVRLQRNKDYYRFILLANLPDITTSRFSHLSGNKESILAGILSEQPDEWMTGSAAGQFTPLPMWAETGLIQVNDNLETAGITGISFTRALAKFDVLVATDEARAAFALEEIYLYNRASRGKVVPAPGNWSAYYKQASMPEESGYSTPLLVRGPLLYPVPVASEHAFEREIYLFETEAARDALDATCIVVGGSYAGATSYYRLDIKDDQGNYRDILRNHAYLFNITKVSGPGYETPEQAFRLAPMNMIATITPWNEGDLNDITFNGQYHLSVDKGRLDFYAEGTALGLGVITDFPEGWRVKGLPDWLEIVGTPDYAANMRSTLTIRVKPSFPIGDKDREGEFFIVAGNLEKPIVVKQSTEAEFSLQVTPDELVFYKTPSSYQEVEIIPYPAVDGNNYNLWFSMDGNITWADGYGINTPPTTILRLKPTPNTGNTTLNGTVFVTLNGPNGRTLSRVINVMQLAREMFFATLSNPYPNTSGEYTFPVASDVTWKLNTQAAFVTLEASESTAAYHPAISSYTYPFKLAASTSYSDRTAIVNVSSSDDPTFHTSFDIVQKGWSPVLNITDRTNGKTPATHFYNFGTSGDSKEVKIETNAHWKYTVVDGSLANMIESATVSSDDVQSLGQSYTPDKGVVNTSVILKPSTSGKIPDVYGGTEISTRLKFETITEDSQAKEVEKELLLIRTVPVYFKLTSPTSLTVPASGEDLTITAETNVQWYIKLGSTTWLNKEITGYVASSSFLLKASDVGRLPNDSSNITRKVKYGIIKNGVAESPIGTIEIKVLP